MDVRSCGAVALLYLMAPCGLPRGGAEVIPLRVSGGRCEAVLPTGNPGDQYYLVLGSLAAHDRPTQVTVRAEATQLPVALSTAEPRPDDGWAQVNRERAERQARARARKDDTQRPPPGPPPQEKTFHLLCAEGDYRDAASYSAVRAALRAVGERCQVYVDAGFPRPESLKATVDEAVRAFDAEVWPRAATHLGRTRDVDRDGRFTILFSHRLGGQKEGEASLRGFVRGSDFRDDVPAPFSNSCDMMYLSTSLRPGPHLRAVLAHEYAHAVVYSEHFYGDYLPGAAREDEEGWLNEALAHLNEEAHGYGWSNLDYRISAFLNAPARYPLVVPDYYRSGLWRAAGVRGATYLFLRWCADRHGDRLVTELVRSNLRGAANLEAATRRRLGELFREWSVALLLTGSGVEAAGVAPYRGLNPRQPLGRRLLCGPRYEAVPMSEGRHEAELAGTAVAYLLLHSPQAVRTRLTVQAEQQADLQVTLVRLPRGCGRLSVHCQPSAEGTVQLVATAHGSRVQLQTVAWELLLPRGEGDEDAGTFHAGQAVLAEGESWESRPIRLPAGTKEGGPVVFKVQGIDAGGRPITGWTLLH